VRLIFVASQHIFGIAMRSIGARYYLK